MDNLEQVAKPEEQPKPSSEKEQVSVASKESKDTTLGKPITETEEFKKAQSGWDKQISLAKAETEKLRKSMEQRDSSYQRLEQAHEKLLSEDPEALEGYRRSKSQAAWEAERDRRDADLTLRESEVERDKEINRLALKAFEVAQTGVPIDELRACTTEREMELVAKLYQKPKEPEATPQIDPAVSTAEGSANWEQIRDDMIKNPSNDTIMRRYMETKKAREG